MAMGPASAAPSAAQGFSKLLRATGSPARAAAISSRPSGETDVLRDRVEGWSCNMALKPSMDAVAGVQRIRAGPAERCRRAARAAHDPSVRQHRRTDAGADRHEDGVPDIAGGAQGGFGEEREVGVVAERHGHAREQSAQILTVEIGKIRDP